jgi:antitoxin MazE
MKSAIRKMGNSHGVIIPKPLLAEIGMGPDDRVDIRIKKGSIVIKPLKRDEPKDEDPRSGWAKECRAVREAGEDGLVWPEFANRDDDKLEW